MKALLKLTFLLAFIICGCIMTTAQGLVDGFYTGHRNLTAVLGAGYENNPTYLAGKRELELEKSFDNANLFIAYGIARRWDLNASAAYVRSDNVSNFQDAAITLKHKFAQLQKGNFEFSAQIAIGIAFPLSNYETEGLNAIGQRATSLNSRFVLHAKHDKGIFTTVQSGIDYKFNPVPDAIASTIKLGLSKSNYYLEAFFDIQNSFNGRDYRGFPAPDNFRELEVDFLRLGTTFFKPLSARFGVFINGTYTMDGRNVGLGPAVNIGLVYNTRL